MVRLFFKVVSIANAALVNSVGPVNLPPLPGGVLVNPQSGVWEPSKYAAYQMYAGPSSAVMNTSTVDGGRCLVNAKSVARTELAVS